METNLQTPTTSSTITDSSSPNSTFSLNTNQVLEITLVSAQDLSPVCKSLRTYALAWVNPNRKRTTRVDNQGHTNPTWNDKFSFRVDDNFLSSDSPAVHVEIYTVSWFRDILLGTVKVLLHNLINPFDLTNKKFVALQIRRPSGNPQGILNMGVALIDKSKRRGMNQPPFKELTRLSLDDHRDILDKKINYINSQDRITSYDVNQYDDDDDTLQINNKIQMWQSQSQGYSEIVNNVEEFPNQAGSVCNGSMVNGSELCSDIGPSASIVAAEIAKKLQPMPVVPSSKELDDGASSILEELTVEEVYSKGLPLSKEKSQLHTRRNTDGGLYSCFGNAYCFEFTIVCGANNNNQGNRRVVNSNNCAGNSRRKKSSTHANSA